MLGIEGADLVVSRTRSAEVGLGTINSGNVNLIHKILKLAEIKGGSCRGIEGTNLVVSLA